MGDASYGNAMTEIALALAMGFFSIMVLTMVSMGAPETAKRPADNGSPVKLTLAPNAPSKAQRTEAEAAPKVIVYWQGRFFDKDLKPFDVVAAPLAGPVILALPPTLSMAEALDARSRIKAAQLVVSTLDARWLKSLGQNIDKE